MPEDNPVAILAEFKIPQHPYKLHPVKHGLINKSYVVVDKSNNEKTYFLQQVDRNAFKDIEGIMHNIGVVSNHFKSQPDAPGHLTTQQTISGANYFKSAAGDYWRLYDFVTGNTYYRAENDDVLFITLIDVA